MLEALDLRLLACHHVLLEDLSEDLLEASGSRQMQMSRDSSRKKYTSKRFQISAVSRKSM